MQNNNLVLIDTVAGFFIIPLCFFIRFFKKIIYIFIKNNNDKILIIKFLGAGNFLAGKNEINDHKMDIVTVKSNFQTLNYFGIGNKVFYINDLNFFSLAFSCITCCFKLFFSNYRQIINLETESKFAKFLTSLSTAKKISGLSNTNKSLVDYWLYDNYLVTPLMESRDSLISQLIQFHPKINLNINSAIDFQKQKFLAQNKLDHLAKIIIAPTCSDTDNLRRLKDEDWVKIIEILLVKNNIGSIDIIFPNALDSQFVFFNSLKVKSIKINIKVTSYAEFIEHISYTDLLISIDSQAVHIAQQLKKKTVAIYGPTNPFGVNISETTYPIYNSLACSPCTHKYLRTPCNAKAPCMNFTDGAFDIFKNINLPI